MKGDWRRVTRRQRCPICGKDDWCLIRKDGTAAICPRVQNGSKREIGESGWLHELVETQAPVALPPIDDTPRTNGELASLMAEYRARVDGAMLSLLARLLRVNRSGLSQMGIGWDGKRDAAAFPMLNDLGEVIGIRLRLANGKKFAVRGSHNGLFCGALRPTGSLVVVEGATDTAAMLGMQIPCVGRPSCSGGTAMLLRLCERFSVQRVTIVADRDVPGRNGARRLAGEIRLTGRQAVVTEPPDKLCKDVREWIARGAKRREVRAWLDEAWTMEDSDAARSK